MDVNLLAQLLKELILDNDRVSLPGMGSFVADIAPAYFSEDGKTINPPFRRIFFRSSEIWNDEIIERYYADKYNLDLDSIRAELREYFEKFRLDLNVKKNIDLPGFGKMRATREGNYFFVPERGLDIYANAFGLEPISLKVLVAESDKKQKKRKDEVKEVLGEEFTGIDMAEIEREMEIERQKRELAKQEAQEQLNQEQMAVAEQVEEAIEFGVETAEQMTIDAEPEGMAVELEEVAVVPKEVAVEPEEVAVPDEVLSEPEEMAVVPEATAVEPEIEPLEEEEFEVELNPLGAEEAIEFEVETAEPVTIDTEPEGIAVELEEVAVEPEEVAVEPEEVAAEPEEITAEPEGIAVEPERVAVAPEEPIAEAEITEEVTIEEEPMVIEETQAAVELNPELNPEIVTEPLVTPPVEEPVAVKEKTKTKRKNNMPVILLAVFVFLIVAAVLFVVFREQLGDILEGLLYSKEELEIIRGSGV